jgi:hypothetical protein
MARLWEVPSWNANYFIASEHSRRKIREQHPSSAQPAKRQPLIDRLNVFHLIEHHRNFTLIQQGMCDP